MLIPLDILLAIGISTALWVLGPGVRIRLATWFYLLACWLDPENPWQEAD